MATLNTLPEPNSYYTRLSIGPYKKDDAFKQASFDTSLVVHLPLPTEMRDDTTVSYTNVNLETVGDAFLGRSNDQMINSAVLRNIGNLTSAGLSATGKGFSNALANRADVIGALGGAFMNTVQSLLPPEQVASAIQQKYGAAPNPNPSVQFQGPVLRDFTLSWAFYPKNQNESRTINDLIKKLKGRALPSDNDQNGGAILNYPHVCQLNFFPWDTEGTGSNGWSDNSIIKIKKCFMSGVNVNYNAFGTPGFFEGTRLPISYQLTISFKEIEYLLAGDWDPEAATERRVASVTADNIVSDAVNLAFNTGAAVVIGTFDAVKELILDNVPDQEELDKVDRGAEVMADLKADDPESKLTIRTDDSLFPVRAAGLWTVTTNAEGKYVVVFDPDDIIDARVGNTERPPESRGTFDSIDLAQAYLQEEDVYADGEITFPPPPEAAAAAP